MCVALRAIALSAPGQCSRISGIRRWRRKLRENRVSAFDGSSIQRKRALRASASISARDTSSNGRAMKPGPNARDRGHAGEARDAGAAKQLEQQCFHLIVAMLGGDQHFAGSHRAREQAA